METKKDNAKSEVAKREEEVLAFWNEHDIFNKSLQKDSPKGDFVFYDGPPFATGLPHYGHILAGTIKDAIPRYRTMNGYRVERKWGWDCHGLPLENIIEKKLGLATKRDIEELGIKQFNETAREAVMEYADDWKRIVPRMGRWADMEHDYRTMDSSYTETVWWIFSELYKKGLVYEGFKSMHLCPRCGTTLSNFEVNQGYQDIKDIAVTVKLPLIDEPDTSLLVWTTTPWTLPGNFGAAVHEDIVYVKVRVKTESGDQTVILAKERLQQLGTEEYEIMEELKGKDLVGKSYMPPFEYFKEQDIDGKEAAWKVQHADFVEIGEEGTGIVHLAPAYGEDDLAVAKEHGIPITHHVGEDGRFKELVTDFAGQLVKPKDDEDVSHLDADIEVVKKLKEKGSLFRKENITHSYPHCWRCDTPLINYATTSWFVEVTKMRDDLVSENEKIQWVPKHVGASRFGKWLEGARDWAVSRQRYWGAPLPIWRNPTTKEYKVFGSLEELQKHVPKSGNSYIVMRHGEAESNVSRTVSTILDAKDPLTENGRGQVEARIDELKEKNIDLIITSPFERTKETAEIVREGLGLGVDSVVVDDRIKEIQVGEHLQGKDWDQHKILYSDFADEFTKIVEGVPETRRDVQKRAGEFLYELEKTHKGKTILIIGHVSSTFALGSAAEGADIGRAVEIKINQECWLGNAETLELSFMPLPHNDNYELDFHRPYIDDIELFDEDPNGEVELPNGARGTKLERVPDVFDCWFESGSMPYGQHHYPFEHKKDFEKKYFPAEFIAEGLDQTRGWFYSMLVLGLALFGESPYKNVIVNGLVLAEDGKKMSKKLQNYPDPVELVERVGADAMRFYLLSSPVVAGEDLSFSEAGALELQRKNIGRLHNVLLMYQQYAGGEPASTDGAHVLDQWIIARTNELVSEVTKGFEAYELDRATRPVTEFIDDLSAWYLRRSRDRLKGEDIEDKKAALGTLRHVLKTLALVMAPSMPFYADYLWRAVKGENDTESVHLADWPETRKIDESLIFDMEHLRDVISKGLEYRARVNIKVRQPLQKAYIHESESGVLDREHLVDLMKDELNVKEVIKTTKHETGNIDTEITPELKREGDVREFIRNVQEGRKQKGLNPEDTITLVIDEKTKELLAGFEDEVKRVVGAGDIIVGAVDSYEIKV